MDSLLFHLYCRLRGVLIHQNQVYCDKVTILIVTRFVCSCDVIAMLFSRVVFPNPFLSFLFIELVFSYLQISEEKNHMCFDLLAVL